MSGERNEIEPADFLYEPSDAQISGRTYEQWTLAWWNWLVGIEKSSNPANDPCGESWNRNQPRELYFLAGQAIGGKARRRVTLNEPRDLFFPLLTYEWSLYEMLGFADRTQLPHILGLAESNESIAIPKDTLDELGELTHYTMDKMSYLQMVLDEGKPRELRLYTGTLCKYRVGTKEAFDITFSDKNIFNTWPGTTKAHSDGYWAFIKKEFLADKKDHTISFQGATEYYTQDIQYNITFN